MENAHIIQYLYKFIWRRIKISVEDKPLLVSGTLIALRNHDFVESFSSYSEGELPGEWFRAIKNVLDAAKLPKIRIDKMIQPYASVAAQPSLTDLDSKLIKQYPQGVLYEIIKEINDHIINTYDDTLIAGHFYEEFLQYIGRNKNALGIILTPQHIAELFCEIADVTKKDIVLDICTGTGEFLITEMKAMLSSEKKEKKKEDIQNNRLIGIENDPKIYTLATSNMLLHGDGNPNIYQGFCFDNTIIEAVKDMHPSIGLLTPPYSQSNRGDELHELYFVKHMLDQLQEGGTGVAIIPVSCVTSSSPAKHDILVSHTLKAVMSMPNDLLYPTSIVTCIVVFEAHKPHLESNNKTWFGYWKDDGFERTKELGRVDLQNKWESIKIQWLEAYRATEVHPGRSTTAYVTSDDEWVPEAYMETDYSKLTKNDFEKIVKNYAVFKLLNET